MTRDAETAPVYWAGNAAKMAVIDEILAVLDRRGTCTVFDYGCGDGGGWVAVLEDHPGLSLVAYEPDERAGAVASALLAPLGATVTSGWSNEPPRVVADVVVSFSVFEHVYDRRSYLIEARERLAPDGVFFLNYDDGHFRPRVELDVPAAWWPAIKVATHNALARVLARAGRHSRFQARVQRRDADALIAEVGLECTRAFYSNVESFKDLYKALPAEARADFCRWWVAAEAALNAEFSADAPMHRGDTAALWRVMPSRTLVLRHAGGQGRSGRASSSP